ncbi:hypothetical protein M9H77_12150 [Catharanthus roseus]|uniref:Uncharacterized protein n=1 Tax=Catharanthus roseus TaxID=4058 RepID=A0ACC0BGQ2_CATRO|nr:hypothetical protein M9H77_12150 [Catharanthus roseus]
MCAWKSNQGDYMRYLEGCSYGAHNQRGNAYSRINHSGTNFTPRRQDAVGNFSPYARSFEHTSYKCYEGNRIEMENGIAYRPFERVPRKETRDEKDYVNMDERFHTKRKYKYGDHFTFFNSLGTYLERRYFIESNSISCASPRVDECDFNSISCASPRVDECDFSIANFVSCVLGVEDRRSMEKEFGPILEDINKHIS